jgi:hypothetical protein
MLARKALAGTAGAPKVYVEDVFSTYLYTGTGSAQTFTNNLDLSGEGGMVWIKRRDSAVSHYLADTERGTSSYLSSNTNLSVETGITTRISAFNNDGFSISTGTTVNNNGSTFVSWSFRQAEKFFDVVTYSGNSVDNRAISHNLGSTPGCVIVRRLDGDDWFVYHRSLSTNDGLRLNKTDAASSNTATVKSVSSTTFTVGTDGMVNTSGSDYVAYLFAHDAGGFGDAGSDNIITCGSYTTDGSGKATINLGYEPQWLLVKGSSFASNWIIVDTMRGLDATSLIKPLYANSNVAEDTDNTIGITSTGFTATTGSSLTFIYIAIRRGPMKTPTSGTSVFSPVIGTSSQTAPDYLAFNSGFPIDLSIITDKSSTSDRFAGSRLTGKQRSLFTNSTSSESTSTINTYDVQNGLGFTISYDVSTWIGWLFRRAPGFFDVVCYTGTGSARTISHNLGVVPELMIVKNRSSSGSWRVYSATTGSGNSLNLENTDASSSTSSWNSTAPTSSVFSVGTISDVNGNGSTYVAYLFASVTGVSKVGSYTGNGSNQTINCGFTGGARLVLIKRTDSTGDWVVFDSARGIVAGNDPYLELNTSDAEVTDKDAVDTDNSGFVVNETTGPNVNTNSATYIYLAIS